MVFLKAHWQKFVFGLVCAASIGAAAWGVTSGDAVAQRMTTVEDLTRAVGALRSSPANKLTIEDRRARNERKDRESERLMNVALSVQKNLPLDETRDADGNVVSAPRVPLLPNVLPKPENKAAALGFRTEYRKAWDRLVASLRAGDKPTRDEVRVIEGRLAPSGGAPAENPWSPAFWVASGNAPTNQNLGSTLEILRQWPESVAGYRKALKLYMYLSDGALGRHALAESDLPPGVVEIWQAQMSLWIQQDMVTALMRCNDSRAEELKAAGRGRWVAHMPVKHLLMLSISDQIGGSSGPGGGQNVPAEGFGMSLTKKKNNQKMFMVPLRLRLIVEEAALPKVLDELCSVGFYTPYNIFYEDVRPNPTQVGYIYGPDPVIEVTIHLEAYYFRRVFDQWIPKSLKKTLETPDCGFAAGGRGGRRGTRFGRG